MLDVTWTRRVGIALDRAARLPWPRVEHCQDIKGLTSSNHVDPAVGMSLTHTTSDCHVTLHSRMLIGIRSSCTGYSQIVDTGVTCQF